MTIGGEIRTREGRGGEGRGGEGESDPHSARCSAVWVFTVSPSVCAVEPVWISPCSPLVCFPPVHPGAEPHTHTEATPVATNWTDSLAIDLLQVSLDSLCTAHTD